MSSRNDRFEYGVAAPSDTEQLLGLYEASEFKGGISVLYTRRPDPYISLQNEGDKAVIVVVRDKQTGILFAAGSCIIRKAFINGDLVNTGYLTGLKVLPGYSRQILYMAEVYSYLHDLTKNDTDFYYTTILNDNTGAQRLLEKGHKNMPKYTYLGNYNVYCFRTGKKQREDMRFDLIRGNHPGLKGFLEKWSRPYNFTPVETGLHGLDGKDFHVLLDKKGDIAAACAVWDQQSYKQYVITGYDGIYRYLRYLPLELAGYPKLPQPGIPADYASLALLSVKDNDTQTGKYLIKKVAENSGRFSFLMAGMFETHPLNAAFREIRHIKYGSRLYTVHWGQEAPILDKNLIGLEVGLL